MSGLESLEELRKTIESCERTDMADFDTVWITSEALKSGLDDIEREVEGCYVRLPVDSDGKPIRFGDEVAVRYSNVKRECCGIGELNGEPCLFWASKHGSLQDGHSYHEHDGWDYAHVVGSRPPSLEEVLGELVKEVWEASCDSSLDGIEDRFAGRVREAVRHEA